MMIIIHQLCFLLILFFSGVICQLVGEECSRGYDNARGICKPHRECNLVREEHKRGIPITFCSYIDSKPIICCPESKRISSTKCEEYGKLVKQKFYVWSLPIPPQRTASKNDEPAGFDVFQCNPSTPLIVGGERAKTNEFPHMAALGWRKGTRITFDCGGSLISERHVITAAHCEISDGIRPSFVRLGDQNLRTREDQVIEVDIDIAEFVRHPQYSSLTNKNDIAIIKLVREVVFSETIRPACLWQSESINTTKVIASGWGALEYASLTSDELMKVELDIIDSNECNNLLSDSVSLSREKWVDKTQICSGILKGGKDTCSGDSGGPIQVSIRAGNPCLYHIIGITSFGSILCGLPNSPAVYTRISAYLDWIEDQVWL